MIWSYVDVEHSKERLELVNKLKGKINNEISSYLEKYHSYAENYKTSMEGFTNLCFIVTAIQALKSYIDKQEAFLKVFSNGSYKVEDIYLKIMLQDEFDVTSKFVVLCQEENEILEIDDPLFGSMEFIDIFDSLEYKKKHKGEVEYENYSE